jgi:hypothetical protein
MRLGRVGHIHVEQVHLVVAPDPLAVRAIHQAGWRHPRFAGYLQRDGAANYGHGELARAIGQHALDGTLAVVFSRLALGAFALRHQGEILRQHCQLRATRRRLCQQLACARQIGSHLHS